MSTAQKYAVLVASAFGVAFFLGVVVGITLKAML